MRTALDAVRYYLGYKDELRGTGCFGFVHATRYQPLHSPRNTTVDCSRPQYALPIRIGGK